MNVIAVQKTEKTEELAASPLPCTTVDELYLPPARAMLKRLAGNWLNHHRLTVTEFIHSPHELERFEATGTAYQHAIQRMAVTLAAKSKTPVVEIIRALNDLADQATKRVCIDEQRGLFPAVKAEKLAEMAEALADDPNARYILNGSLAKSLAAKTWNDKLLKALALRAHAPKEGPGRALFLSLTDTIVAEIVGDESVLIELFGAEMDFGQRLLTAIDIFQGQIGAPPDETTTGLQLMARHFADGELADARLAVASFILSECKGTKRLCPTSLDDELMAFRHVVDKLTAATTEYLNPDDLNAAFVERSKQFVTQEALSQFIVAGMTPDEKLECLLTIGENIKGAANKRALAPFALAFLRTPNLEENFAKGTPGILRIKCAADLQKRVLCAGFPDAQRDKTSEILDDFADRIEAKGNFFAGLEARMADPVERVDTYLRMFATGMFTEGKLMRKARGALLTALSTPNFLTNYTMGKAKDAQSQVFGLISQLEPIGISPIECLRALIP
ncbi:MAG: hypothetical protein WCA81_09615 [Rhizomicrobium sp.]